MVTRMKLITPDNTVKEAVKTISFRVVLPTVGWLTGLGCFLVVLKALGKITLPWWGVLLPFYWWAALLVISGVLAAVVFGIILLACWIIDVYDRHKRRQLMKKQPTIGRWP